MAPLKFEDRMREKLEQRTIQPSKESWNKLEQALDGRDEENKIKKNWWLGIAASFVGILIITSFFLKSNFLENKPATNYVENTEKTPNAIEDKTEVVEVRQTEKSEPTNLIDTSIDLSIERKELDKEQPSIVHQGQGRTDHGLKNEKDRNKTTVVHTTSVSQENRKAKEAITIDSMDIKEQVILVATQVRELEENNGAVTDEEITKLLMQAQRDITTKQILKSNEVNALSLLSDVESELDETFKQKVFEALKSGFQKIKTSVVERGQ